MVCRPLKAALYNFLTADGRPQTAGWRRIAVGGRPSAVKFAKIV
jgi:hypothetical protein